MIEEGDDHTTEVIRKDREVRTDAHRLSIDPFGGDRDVHIECHSVKVVTTRKEHWCAISGLYCYEESHNIPMGSWAIRESAKVDGKFGSCYWCKECVDRILDAEAIYREGF